MKTIEQQVLSQVDILTLPTEDLKGMLNMLNDELQRRQIQSPSHIIEDYFESQHIPRLKMLCFDAYIEQLSTLSAYRTYRATLSDLSKVNQNTFVNVGSLDQKLWAEIRAVLKENGYPHLHEKADDKVVKLNPYF
jgi:hypothetical protein